jgi:hypothetical protein
MARGCFLKNIRDCPVILCVVSYANAWRVCLDNLIIDHTEVITFKSGCHSAVIAERINGLIEESHWKVN